jgi:hypothetical protein
MEWLKPEVLLEVSLAALGFVIWLLRLEGKVIAANREIALLKDAQSESQKDIDHLRVKQEAIDERVANELKEINVRLAQIEGFLLRPKNAPRK